MAIPAETQFHVLAVDDSLIDRKLIERLLKTSSYQGIFLFTDDEKKNLELCNFFWFSSSGVLNFLFFFLGFVFL